MATVPHNAGAVAGLSPTVTAVFDRILADVLGGRRRPGSIVRDADIARELGVSRTPVREALQLLRSAGVVEVLPSRFTRIAVLDATDIERASAVSLALYGLVVEEIAASQVEIPFDLLEGEQEAAAGLLDRPSAFFVHAFRLHDRIVQLSRNEHLLRSIDAVVHALRLAIVSNADGADAADLARVLDAQHRIIDGLRRHDPRAASEGVAALRQLERTLQVPSAG